MASESLVYTTACSSLSLHWLCCKGRVGRLYRLWSQSCSYRPTEEGGGATYQKYHVSWWIERGYSNHGPWELLLSVDRRSVGRERYTVFVMGVLLSFYTKSLYYLFCEPLSESNSRDFKLPVHGRQFMLFIRSVSVSLLILCFLDIPLCLGDFK